MRITEKDLEIAKAKLASHNELMKSVNKPQVDESLELIIGLVAEYRSIIKRKRCPVCLTSYEKHAH